MKRKKITKGKLSAVIIAGTLVMTLVGGCGSTEGTETLVTNDETVETSETAETDASEEVSEEISEGDSESTVVSDETVCWIAETEKEKALTARGEYYSYEVASNDTENYTENDIENTADENTTDNITDDTTGNTGSTTTENSTDSSTSNSTTSKDSSTNESISKSTSGSSSSGSSSSSTGSSSTSSSGSSSGSSSSGTSSGSSGSSNTSGTSSGSSNKTTTTTTEAASTVCSHSWKLTNTKAEEGYYTYYCTSCSYGSGHTATRYVCNDCGAVFETREAYKNHSLERIAYAEANYTTAKEIAMNSCGAFTIKHNYQIDNIPYLYGTATKSWVTTSKGVYTYTCSKCGETKTETFTESHPSSTISFTIDPYNGEDVDSWLNSNYN